MRLLPAALVALVLLLTGCSSSDDEGGDGADSGAERVGVGGITFEKPEGWRDLDSAEMTEDAADDELMQNYQENMGMSDEQLQQILDSVDLYLVTGEGASNGFLDNIVGTEVAGTMPNDSELEAEFLATGADVVSLDRVDTEAGEAARVVYELPSGSTVVKGQALSIATDDAVVSFTVSSGDSDTAADLMEQVVDSLAAD